MAYIIYCLFALLIFSDFGNINGHIQTYKSLIFDVHKHYDTSSVFFVYTGHNRYLEEYTWLHSLSRDFSRKSVFTMIINFEELDGRVNWYQKQISRPLIVIFLRTVSDIIEFNENTETMMISYPIWLVIFTNRFGEALCEYCKYPKKNYFRLRFDTEMMVLCCENPMLKEWWSVDSNKTEISDFGTWTTNKSLTVHAIDGLFSRRHDFQGTGFRIGIVTNSVFVYENGNKIEGFFGDVLTELKRVLNFTITNTIRDPGYGTWSSTSERWSGIIGQLISGKVDLGAADFSITKSRLLVLDYTLPLTVSRSRLYVKDPDESAVQWSAYFQAFTFTTWMAIILLIIIALIVISVIKMRSKTVFLLSLFVEDYLYVWGIFCQQGLSEYPVAASLRIAYLSMFILALVVSAAYSASLVSFLTITSSGLPFTTLEGFVRDGSYKIIVSENQAEYDLLTTSRDPLLNDMKALMKPSRDLPLTSVNGWEQVCKQKVGLYTHDWDYTMVWKKISEININCKVTEIDGENTDSLAMIMPADSQYKKVINYHIQRFRDTGILNHLKYKYVTQNAVEHKPQFIGANLWGVAPVLATLIGGIIISSILLFCEKIYYYLREKKRTRTHFENFQNRSMKKAKNRLTFVKNQDLIKYITTLK